MATDRIALLRVFNTAAISPAVRAGAIVEGGWHVTYDMAAGTYWSFLAVIDEFRTALLAHYPASTVYLGSDYKLIVTFASPEELSFYDATTADYFGFESASQSASSLHIADRVSPFFWISTYAPADQVDFYWEQNEIWKGVQAMDGTWVGRLQTDPLVAGNNLKMNKSLALSYETAARVFFSMPVTAFDTYRALDYFVMMTRAQTIAANGHEQCTGVHFFWDADDIKDNSIWGDASTVHGAFTTLSPYTFCYCTISPSGMRAPQPALPAGKTHYNVSLNLETASPCTSWIGW